MAVVNTKALAISNNDRSAVSGSPDIVNALLISGGKVISKVGLCAKLTTDSNNSVYRFARISSSSRISSAVIICDAMAGLTAVDVGLYDVAANGGAVVSQHLFSTGVDLHTGNTTPLEQRFVNLAAASIEQPVWKLLGLSADPQKSYDVCLTATTAGAIAGNIGMEVLEVTGMQ
jgi:hypothetical protein